MTPTWLLIALHVDVKVTVFLLSKETGNLVKLEVEDDPIIHVSYSPIYFRARTCYMHPVALKDGGIHIQVFANGGF